MATKLGTLTLDLVARIGSFTQGMRQASTTAEREMGRVQNSVVTVDGLIKKLAVTAGAVFSVGQIISYTDKYTGLQNKLKLVTNSQSELNKAMQDTFDIAQNTGSAWDSTAMVYQRFSENAKRLGITMSETASLTETVSKAISISGGSAASAEAALMQFGQALASGVLRGEEFNSISEQAPGLLKAIAKGIGVNVGELRAMAGEGKITGDVLVDALGKAKPYIDDLFGKTDFTIANSFTQLNNAVTQFVGEAGKGSGAAKLLSTSISTLANNLEPIANAGAALAVGLLAKAMIGGMAATTNATYALIAKADASIAERQANIASTQAELASAAAEARSTQITLTNAKATHAQIMAEIQLEQVRLKAQVTDQGRMATITRMAQLGRLQAQVALEIAAAETAQASASTRLATAQAAVAAATSRMALAKAALMSVFSPMGLAIAATAATFYLLSDSSDEVKESLATQSESVEDLTAKYRELNSVQALTEGLRLRKEIDQQNEAIDDASSSAERYAYFQKEMFKLSGSDYADYQKAITAIKTGASDAGDLLNKMIQSGRFSQPQIDKMIEFSATISDSKTKIEQNNTALKMLNATSGEHAKVTEQSLKQLGVQANLVKLATQNYASMKVQMLESLQAQLELSRLSGASEETIKALSDVISKYSLNQLSASDAVAQFNQKAKIPKDVLGGIQEYAVKTDGAKEAVNKAVVAQKALATATGTATGEIKKQAGDVAGLNAELKKLIELSSTKTRENQLTTALVSQGHSKALADLIIEYRKAEGIFGTGKALSKEATKSLKERWKSEQGLNKTLEDQTKAQEKSKKLIEAQGAAMKVNARVAANAAKYNFASIESKNNLPAGLLSAIHMQESKGDPSAYNKSSGATGGFQFLKGTADQYGVKNRNDLAQSAEGAGKYMAYLLKLFKGDLDKAVSAYHAGEGNVQRGTNIGPVNRQYVKNIKGYMGGASGVSFTEDYSYDDYIKEQEQLVIERENQAQKQKEIQVRYYSDWQNLEADNQEKIKDIQESFANNPAERDRLIELQAKAYEVDVGNWFKAQDEKVAAEREANKQILAERYNLINASLAMQGQIKGLSSGAEDINARASMSPQAYAEWSLSNNRSNAQLDLKNQRVGVEQDIMTSDLYSNDDDRYQALLDAHQEYRDGLAAIDVEYDQQVKELAQSQSQTQMDIWQDLLSRTGTIFSSMAEMVKNTAGESSTAYKVMFLTNQGISMAQAMINTEVAATKAMAEGGYVMGIPMATAIRGLGYASVGMIAAQTISGMAHDGIDNIPKEGTWLLDKGERVVDSRTNGDLKDYLAKGGGGGGNVTINQSINIASDGTATTQNESKQLGALINNAVLAVIRKEQRQGGLLSR